MADYKGTEGPDTINAVDLKLADWTAIYGLGGDDVITARWANIIGGPGNDKIIALDNHTTAAYWGSPAAIYVDLAAGTAKDGWGGTDTLVGVRSVHGTGGDDTVLGSDEADIFYGNNGNDYFDGRGGNDTYAVFFEPSTNFKISFDSVNGTTILENITGSDRNGGKKVLKNVEYISFQGDGSDGKLVTLSSLMPSGFTRIAGTPFDAQDAGTNPRWAVADFNKDGLIDIAIRYDPESSFSTTITGSAPLRFFLGQAQGGFVETTSLMSPAVAPTLVNRIQTTDLNKDGVADIIIGASGQDPYENGQPSSLPRPGEKTYIVLSQPNGTFAQVSVAGMPDIFAHHLVTGDINGDGYDDIFVSSVANDPSYFLISNKGTSFTLDRSVLPSVLTTNQNVTLTTFSTGEWKTSYDYRATASALFDVDGDGAPDLVTLPMGGGGVGHVFFNNGKGSFAGTRMLDLPAGPYGAGYTERSSPTANIWRESGTIYLDAVSADVNGDGRLDLIALSTETRQSDGQFIYYRGASVSILINTPNGFVDETATRSDFKHAPAANYSHYDTVAYQDFNADGFEDILLYRSPGNSGDGAYATRILINDGKGHFKEAPYPIGLPDGLIILTDEVRSQYALPTSMIGAGRAANGLTDYIQSVDGALFDWSKGLDLFTGKPDGRGAILSSDIPGRWVHGTAADNVITLSSGDELAFGYQGNDTIDGGAGYDTAVYAGRYADVSIKLSGNTITVTTKTEGIDTLTNIEALRFADQTVTLAALKRDLTPSGFSLVADTGFAGSIGGSGRVVGTTGAQDITVGSRAGTVSFDPSFNAGGDIIRLPGKAADWTIQRTGSSAKLVSDTVAATIPIGTTANWIVFSDGARSLAYKDGSFKIGGQSFADAAVKITAASDGTAPSLTLNADANGRLILSEGAGATIGGKAQVIGTSAGKELVEVLGGKISFDPSFNGGGDVINLPGNANAWSAVRSGSSMLLTKGNDSASIPIGTAGTDIAFDNATRALIFASGQFKIGTQVIDGSAPATLMG